MIIEAGAKRFGMRARSAVFWESVFRPGAIEKAALRARTPKRFARVAEVI